jgi:hypothetical protein
LIWQVVTAGFPFNESTPITSKAGALRVRQHHNNGELPWGLEHPELPGGLNELLEGCWSRNFRLRPSAETIARSLYEILQAQSTPSNVISPPPDIKIMSRIRNNIQDLKAREDRNENTRLPLADVEFLQNYSTDNPKVAYLLAIGYLEGLVDIPQNVRPMAIAKGDHIIRGS